MHLLVILKHSKKFTVRKLKLKNKCPLIIIFKAVIKHSWRASSKLSAQFKHPTDLKFMIHTIHTFRHVYDGQLLNCEIYAVF
jgi:hypothetical protein